MVDSEYKSLRLSGGPDRRRLICPALGVLLVFVESYTVAIYIGVVTEQFKVYTFCLCAELRE